MERTLTILDLNEPVAKADGRSVYLSGWDDVNVYVVVDAIEATNDEDTDYE